MTKNHIIRSELREAHPGLGATRAQAAAALTLWGAWVGVFSHHRGDDRHAGVCSELLKAIELAGQHTFMIRMAEAYFGIPHRLPEIWRRQKTSHSSRAKQPEGRPRCPGHRVETVFWSGEISTS